MKTNEKVKTLRIAMERENVDAVIVPSFDAHQSEYVGEHWKSRRFITGFSGSAGTAVILKQKAGLWTDGRYFIQAANQLKGSVIDLYKMGEPGVPVYEDWLQSELPSGGCVSFDGRVIPVSLYRVLEKKLKDKKIKFRIDLDLVGEVWKDRPEIPKDKIFEHDVKYAGKSRAEKLAQIRSAMKAKGADYYLLSALDDLCWLFNIRGNDIPFNPYVTAYALIDLKTAVLFLDTDKVSPELREKFLSDGIDIKAYDEIYSGLKSIDANASILFDPEKTNVRLYGSMPQTAAKIEASSLVTPLKAVKNEVEIENIKDAYIKDGVALVKLFKWLKENAATGKITETGVDKKGEEFRKQLPLFVELSFETISAYKEHAAMMHYIPKTDTEYTLQGEGFYLIDSGSHFQNGTTDITRTVPLGKLTDEQKRDFTLVLKSVIALSTAKFLYGATGSNLDVLARMPMWENGLDYKCGSGHGVGYFSNVHEDPQRFSQKQNTAVLEPGMTITIEPGVYKESRHGIRTENTVLVVEDSQTECGRFMRFETLCYLPIDRSAILPKMLTEKERNWINHYHKEIYEKLAPHLDRPHQEWLEKETAEI